MPPGAIPEMRLMPTATQIFMFSAATWNRHHIHYSKDAALAEGHTDIVVQRALIGNFFANQIGEWLGDAGEIREISWKVLSSAVPGVELTCRAKVIAMDADGDCPMAKLELEVLRDSGRIVATGAATVALTSGHWPS
jgi:hydroxyacyl-ACP dehydratase HTD2-like protein with hotdog domain